MKAAFPYFGYDTLALKTFIENLGASVVLPPATTKRTLELGVKLSPELVCLPYKITMGNFIEALDNGADTLFMAAGARKCRFGYYHYLQETCLRQTRAGLKQFKLHALSQYSPYQFVFEKIPSIFSVSPTRVIRALLILLAKSALIETFRRRLRWLRAIDFDRANKYEKQSLKMIESANSLSEIRRARKSLAVSSNGKQPEITVGLVGEIFFMIEPFANQEIEKELGRLGALVISKRSLFRHLKHLFKIDIESYRSTGLASPYLKACPGGEAIKTVAEAVQFARQGVDGLVHIYPFTCMPENIALAALEKISDEYNIPLLSLSFDEHASRTGFLTRLEAFVDLVKRRKQNG